MRCLTFYQALSHPSAPELGKEQSTVKYGQVGGELSRTPSRGGFEIAGT